ncbi:hypothetical protein [Candidatus Nitrososphaera evergladensis]|uniref:hypothetical protein n=1 Tax=Candidatus Nitrososphaera evergladensis TaxID=1459637 RepID=UPI001D05A845|nr:hypothetical protein [Candidatus Nitrososphaera evergladensis]
MAREIESWKGFADSLRAEDRKLFTTMLDNCHIYAAAINAKGEPFPTEALLMALIFQQQRMINWFIEQVKARKKKST